MDFSLSTEQENAITTFLKKDGRNIFIEDWLVEDHGLDRWKAKGLVKLILAPLTNLTVKVAGRGVQKIHEALRKHSDRYDKVSSHFAKLLLVKLECDRTKTKYSKQYLKAPEGEAPEKWKELNEQTQAWIKQLEQLEIIALSLGELKATIKLHLDQPKFDKNSPPSRLLRPYNAFIPLTGRDDETEQLKSWRDAENPFIWKIMIGEGGIGKTRLAQEFSKGCGETHWVSGFLDHDSLENLVHHDNFLNWMPLTNTMIIVDYAATKLESLKKLVHQCAQVTGSEDGQEEPIKLRLLLLERHADANQGWLKEVLNTGEGALADDIPDTLHPVLELKQPKQKMQTSIIVDILQSTLNSWEKLNGEDAPQLPDLSEDDLWKLQRNTGGRPLYLQMAALHTCDIGSTKELVQWNRATLLQDAVKRERKYIGKLCSSSPKILVERLVALLFFAGKIPVSHPGLLEIIEEEAKICGYPHTPPGEIATILSQFLREDNGKGTETSLDPIQPDLIGAAFSATVLQEKPKPGETLNRAVQLGKETAWANLLRSAQDLFGMESFKINIWLNELTIKLSRTEMWTIANLLPQNTVALAPFAVQLYERMLEKCQNLIERAIILDRLGIWYGRIGKRDVALDVNLQTVRSFEELSKQNSNQWEPRLAMSLNNLGACYLSLGIPKEALKAALSAKEIYKKLVKLYPGTFESEFALNLNNLGVCFGEMGDYTDALDATLHSVKIYKYLADINPDIFNPGLATSIQSLSNRYSQLGNWNKALETAKSGSAIFEQLSKQDPDAYEVDFAKSLIILSHCFDNLGNFDKALESAEQASNIYERLARQNPSAFEPEYALILTNLGNINNNLGNHKKAIEITLKAVGIRGHLAKKYPDAFEPLLASSLSNLGCFYGEIGSNEEALDATQRALKIRRQLAQKNYDQFAHDLANTLTGLGHCLWVSGSTEKALKTTLEGKKMWEELVIKNPDAFNPDLALTLKHLAGIYGQLENNEEGLSAIRESVKIYEDLATKHPEKFEADLGRSLNVLAVLHLHLEKYKDASITSLNAIEIFLPLTEATETVLPDLAHSLHLSGFSQLIMGNAKGSHEHLELGIKALTLPFSQNPDAFTELMHRLIRSHKESCEALGIDAKKDLERLLGPE
jgi:tetratricopeptide repeat protein